MKTIIIALGLMFAGIATFAQVKHPPMHMNHPHIKYTCPMHSEVVSNKPGKCPKCGMKLVKMKNMELKSDKPMSDMKM